MEARFTERAPVLDFGPLPDAREAEAVQARVDFAYLCQTLFVANAASCHYVLEGELKRMTFEAYLS